MAIVGSRKGSIAVVKLFQPDFVYDKRKDGWKLVEAGEPLIIPVSGEFKFELVEILEPNENPISGDEMRRRATTKKASLGQHEAELLEKNREVIPKDWRNYFLLFPKTVWRGPSGDLGVPCLARSGGRWYLYFYWLRNGVNSYYRLVRLCE